MVVIPTLLVPAAIWLLSWLVTDKNWLAAALASLASILLLVDLRFTGALLAGLDYFSTFQIGLYTQPLGFVLLIAWFVVYSNPSDKQWKFALSSFLLAFTLLTNFFNAITAAFFILATLTNDVVHYFRESDPDRRRANRKELVAHLLSPVVAVLMALFWLVPMITEYPYFVTRPYTVQTGALFTPALLIWYALAVLGSVLWLRHPARLTWTYLGACVIIASAVLFASIVAPPWFPFQTPRFVATLTFLLAVPVGYALAAAFRMLASVIGAITPKRKLNPWPVRVMIGIAFALFLIRVVTAPNPTLYDFYPSAKRNDIDPVLSFARQHRDGRYLVEVINQQLGPAWTEASFDARALNSYLGSQGNETISGVFHEASPNALFTLPLVNAFSNFPDSFGISSVLADDLDFGAQPLTEHIKRAQLLGVKYLIIRTPAMKDRIGKEISATVRQDFKWWSVFELPNPPAPKVQVLHHKPALVLSSFSVKARRRNQLSFMRLAEEQFADNWFDVLLARSSELKVDRLQDLDNFGALILEEYEYDNENAAFERLRGFAQNRPLIVFKSANGLFRRLQAIRADLPLLEIIERQAEEAGEKVEALKASFHYNGSAIRQQWKSIRAILERGKITTNSTSEVTGDYSQNTINLQLQ